MFFYCRAKKLLICIGDPHVLQYTPWSNLVEYCTKLKVYIGCDLPSKFQAFDEYQNMNTNAQIQNSNPEENSSSQVDSTIEQNLNLKLNDERFENGDDDEEAEEFDDDEKTRSRLFD